MGHLKRKGYPDLTIDRWPDDENSTTRDIDAIAGPFAIEHTSIDTIENQRRSEDWFTKAIKTLESELTGQFAFSVSVYLKYEGFSETQKWPEVHKALKRFILDDVPELGWGEHELNEIPGIPFTVYAIKSSERPFYFRLGRSVPEHLSHGLPWNQTRRRPSLPENLKAQLDDKTEKLVPYRKSGKITVLLIESEDIAFMNPRIMRSWLEEALHNGLPHGVERIWYAARYSSDCADFKDFTDNIMDKGRTSRSVEKHSDRT